MNETKLMHALRAIVIAPWSYCLGVMTSSLVTNHMIPPIGWVIHDWWFVTVLAVFPPDGVVKSPFWFYIYETIRIILALVALVHITQQLPYI